MGKVLRELKSEVEKSAWVCEYYAHNEESCLLNEPIVTEYSESYISFRPLGVIHGVC
jgi:succinate-semialdehyde dehydrogenase/glutarate-semialdehyde dehydrogenase